MARESQAHRVIGARVKSLRESSGTTLDQLAQQAGISYQYLSGIENGKVNFSIGVIEDVAEALGLTLKDLVVEAPHAGKNQPPPALELNCFNPSVPLPPGLAIQDLQGALNLTMERMQKINTSLLPATGKTLPHFIQGNNLSGLVSNLLTDSLSECSAYKHNHHQRYPDLVNPNANKGKGEGLEVKATINVGKGGESHNGHGGWHLVACYELHASGDIRFVHVMIAPLNAHTHSQSDWKYQGNKENTVTGSRRTETYSTNAYGTTKLRDGSVYLDPARVDFKRWRHQHRNGQIPAFSIFHKSLDHE